MENIPHHKQSDVTTGRIPRGRSVILHARSLIALTFFALSSLLIVPSAHANDIFEPIQLGLLELLCKHPKQRFECYQLDPNNCQTISTPFVATCVTKHVRSKSLEALSNTSILPSLSKDLYSCLNSEFTNAYGNKKLATKECQDV